MYRIRAGSCDIETDTVEEALAVAELLAVERDRERMAEYERQDRAWIAPMHQPVNT